MPKLILKIGLGAAIVNAAWQLGSEYKTYYAFRDAVHQAALVKDQTDEGLRQRVLELAGEYGVPLEYDTVAVRRDEQHTIVEGAYVKPITLLPGYRYPWRFSWTVDGYVITPPALHDVLPPAASPQ